MIGDKDMGSHVAQASASTDRPRVHPVVRMIYTQRMLGLPLMGVGIATLFWQHAPQPWAWWFLGFVGLIWPQLAFQLASRARDGIRQERRSHFVDAFIAGICIALTGFNF